MALLDDIGDFLTAQGVVGGATGWTLRLSHLTPTPDKVVVVYETPGLAPDQTVGLGAEFPGIQVRARASALDYESLRSKLQDIYNVLNNATISGYVYCYAQQSGPLPMGLDENERPGMVWNYQLMKPAG